MEDARIASIGTLRMEGVARNLDAALEALCRQAAFDTITAETEAPLSVAVGLIVRQRITGRELPPSAENVVRFWRDYVEERAGKHIDLLRDKLHNQAEYADASRSLLKDLGLVAEFEDQDFTDNEGDAESVEDLSESDSEASMEDVVLEDDTLGDEDEDGETAIVELDADMDMSELAADAEDEEAPKVGARRAGTYPHQCRLQALHHGIRRSNPGGETLRVGGTHPPAHAAGSALVPLQHATSRLANRLQRRLLAKQMRAWAVRSGRGHSGRSATAQVVVDPMNPLTYKQEERDQLSRHGRHHVDRQFRFHARPVDHHRRNVRRYPRAHAGTVLGVRGDPRLHDARMARRAVPGGMDQQWQTCQSRPAERSAAHRLQVGGRSWRRTRRNLGLMMREELLKENIDGEALIWAHNRLAVRPEQRRVLMVISDGLPRG